MKIQEITVGISVQETVNILANQMFDSDLIYEEHHSMGYKEISILMYEKYYLRNESYAGLTITISNEEGLTRVRAIASAGSHSAFNFSLGADANFTNKVISILEPYQATAAR